MNAMTKPVRKAAAEPTGPLPEEVRKKLSEARARSAALTARQLELAEKSVQSPEVEKAYFEVCDQLSTTHGEIERLELAITSLDAKAKRQLEESEAAEIRALQGRVADMLDQRVEAARVFEAAITEAVSAMRRLAALGKAVHEAWPGQQPTAGVIFGGQELSILIAGEMYRQAGAPIPTGGATGSSEMPLPAPRAPTIMTMGEPSLIKPLTTAIEEANTYGKASLEIGA